ncbi:protein phyllo [Quercus suber]|uniref:Protein phyllo n=1 Tax=Quercus suber TaxID=58331 RepID=A0AAW0LFR5_QUESU
MPQYLSTDSTFIMIYGFMDINFNIASSKMNEAGSYLFIPQIELDEYEGVSFLAATLAWNNSSLCSFEEAVRSYEFSLKQQKEKNFLISPPIKSKQPPLDPAKTNPLPLHHLPKPLPDQHTRNHEPSHHCDPPTKPTPTATQLPTTTHTRTQPQL